MQTSGSCVPIVTSATFHSQLHCVRRAAGTCARQTPDKQSETVHSCGLIHGSLRHAHWPSNNTNMLLYKQTTLNAHRASQANQHFMLKLSSTKSFFHTLAADRLTGHCASVKTAFWFSLHIQKIHFTFVITQSFPMSKRQLGVNRANYINLKYSTTRLRAGFSKQLTLAKVNLTGDLT